MVGWLMNDDLESMYKEVVVVLWYYLAICMEKPRKTVNQNQNISGWDWKLTYLENASEPEAELLGKLLYMTAN